MGERSDAVSLDKRPRGFIASELNLAENTIRDVPALPLRIRTPDLDQHPQHINGGFQPPPAEARPKGASLKASPV
jgi:hypothetical protein